MLAKNIANPRSEISAGSRRDAKTRVSLSNAASFSVASTFYSRDNRNECEPVSSENLH